MENAFLTYQVDNDFKNYFKSMCAQEVQEKACDTTVEGAKDNVGPSTVRKQNAYITLPEDVVGVVQILQTRGGMGMGGVIPPGSLFPMMMGGAGGSMECGGGFSLTTFYAMQGYMALLNFLLRPPTSWNFNQRTHRLSIHGDLSFAVGQYIAIEVMIKPSPDTYPDLYNDMWMKEYCVQLVAEQWGKNLTKYQQVQMPGGITLNGEKILGDAQQALQKLRDRFAMDFADPPTAILVG